MKPIVDSAIFADGAVAVRGPGAQAGLAVALAVISRVLLQVLQLAIGGTAFLARSHDAEGDAFAIGIFPPRLVFLFDPAAVLPFFTAGVEDIDFRAAVEHFTQRIFQLSNDGFWGRHQRLWRGLRNLLTGSSLQLRAEQLTDGIQEALRQWWPEDGEVDVMEAVKHTISGSVLQLIYGAPFVAHHGHTKLHSAFFDFEAGFEVAASPLPHFLQPRFCDARRMLLAAFRESVAAGHFRDTVAGSLLQDAEISDSEAPHVLLAVLWAAMANSVPAAFWTLVLLSLPEHRDLVEAIRAQLSTVPAPERVQHIMQMTLDPASVVRRSADEGVRLFAPSINVRVAARELTLPAGDGCSIRVARNTILGVCPFLVHRDSRLFPDRPGAFLPQRYAQHSRAAAGAEADGADDKPETSLVEAMGELGAIPGVSQAGMSFGGGRFRCPGRAFAEVEIAVFVAHILLEYDLTIVTPPPLEPPPWWQALCPVGELLVKWRRELSPNAERLLPLIQHRRLVGIKWPASDCTAHCRLRS